MRVELEGNHDLYLELRSDAADGVPLLSRCVTSDVVDLAEETYLRGVLGERLPLEYTSLRAKLKPVWATEPLVRDLELTLTAETPRGAQSYTQHFTAGRWVRTAEAARLTLIEEGTVGEDSVVFRALRAVPRREPPEVEMPPLEPPLVAAESLEEYGVRRLGAGELVPDRPVLVSRRMTADILERTERAGTNEAGGAVLGKILWLAEPLPGAATRIVTILSVGLTDDRHVGDAGSFRFNPEALAEAAEIARLRGRGEAILTTWHSHGWSPRCANCIKEACGFPGANLVSADDYQLLESLFSSKATLLPIAGRRPGSQAERPVMMIHHWSRRADAAAPLARVRGLVFPNRDPDRRSSHVPAPPRRIPTAGPFGRVVIVRRVAAVARGRATKSPRRAPRPDVGRGRTAPPGPSHGAVAERVSAGGGSRGGNEQHGRRVAPAQGRPLPHGAILPGRRRVALRAGEHQRPAAGTAGGRARGHRRPRRASALAVRQGPSHGTDRRRRGGRPVNVRPAQGEMASFKGYHNREEGLAFVSRFGREEEIVSLAESIQRKDLKTGDRLVLHRDNPRWAIDVVPGQQIESKYEIPIEQLTTRLDDLAGLDGVAGEIIEDWLLRLVRKDIADAFDLRQLGGILMYSYKAGMGKTALVRALARWLRECGHQHGFDVVLYHIEPCALKSMWHGEDARLVREEVCGTIRARLERPRERPLIILVVFDEVESLGKRTGGNDTRGCVSSAQNDAVQALLTGMDGLAPLKGGSGPPANVVWIGLTNRPDMVDEALKRPGRMGDLIVEMPDYGPDEAADILQVYARSPSLAWYLDGEIRRGASEHEVYARILQPAVAQVFPLTVLRYWTEARQATDVTAGQVLAAAHYMNVIEQAKRRAAARALWELGAAAIGAEDVTDCLLEEAHKVAQQLDADRQMLERQLHLRIAVLRTELVPLEQLSQHRYSPHRRRLSLKETHAWQRRSTLGATRS